MELVIGGRAQGKLEYVKQNMANQNYLVLDGQGLDIDFSKDHGEEPLILNHLHLFIRKSLKEGGNPEKEIKDFISKYNNLIIISDEIGNGIVPIDSFERDYRERTGRLLIELAKEADKVTRVFCGIGQVIK